MKSIILVLLVCSEVFGQDGGSRNQRRMATSYSSSIVHSDDKNMNKDNLPQSSVNVNFHNSEAQQILLPQQAVHNFSPPDFVRDHQESQAPNPINEVHYEALKQPQHQLHHQMQQLQEAPSLENVYHTLPLQQQQKSSPILEIKQNNHQGSYLAALATKQYLNTNPLQLQYRSPAPKSTFSGQHLMETFRQPSNNNQQLYNVGYSINIENNAPKLTYRVPNPPNRNAHSYRQQKLLNGDVITGMNKVKVEKPFAYSNNQDTHLPAATNVHPSNYISLDHGKRHQFTSFPSEKPFNKGYSDVTNTHGYTWKNLSPNVEISGYHSLNNNEQHSQSHAFDHAGALGRSQGFDISNVVENGKKPYKNQHSSSSLPATSASGESHQAFDINRELSAGSQITPDIGDIPEGPGDSQNDYFKFPFGEGAELLNYQATPFQHNLLSPGTSNIEFDKTLLDGFYKNYNPNFYQSEITIPNPTLPHNIKLQSDASNQVPSIYNVRIAEYNHNTQPAPVSDAQVMVNQHYAFAQAESLLKHQPQAQAYTQQESAASDVKPVQEAAQEEIHPQQTQTQLVTVQKPIQKEFKSKHFVGMDQHKKSIAIHHPQNNHPIPYRHGFSASSARPLGYEKNYKIKTGLRPPPMYVIHQKY